MKTSDFFYELPHELIAQTPLEVRDSSRLMVLDREKKSVSHRVFTDILDYFEAGDAIVINNTRVIAARLMGKKALSETSMEVFLLKRKSLNEWEVLLKPAKKLKIGDSVIFSPAVSARLLKKNEDGTAEVAFSYEGLFENVLDELGRTPLPPYITEKLQNPERYQTVYAAVNGSAAAPTAGLHFTPELLGKLKSKGVEAIEILLHVGLGTFRPVKVRDLEQHHMHCEYYCVSKSAAERYNAVKKAGGKICAVGTTTVRTLETVADESGFIKEAEGETDIFIYPGCRFKTVDRLITNFHIPESTLLMLVSAFAGREFVLQAYQIAVKEKYRFFSFGDAMLIL